MKEEKTKSKKRILYYCILTISVLLLAAAIVLTVYFVTDKGGEVLDNPNNPNEPVEPDNPTKPTEPDEPDDPTGGDNVDPNPYVAPISVAKYSMEYGEIYKNKTIGWIYRHKAIDFTVEAGTEVCAMAEGTVSKVSYSKELGNLITIDHGNGLQSCYSYVEPVAGLGVGQTVQKGEKIGTVAEEYGSEYKDGAHLHFEVKEGKKPVNPTKYIQAYLEEK